MAKSKKQYSRSTKRSRQSNRAGLRRRDGGRALPMWPNGVDRLYCFLDCDHGIRKYFASVISPGLANHEKCPVCKISVLRPQAMITFFKNFYCTKKYRKATHCLFDLDGTVLDSEVIYHKAIRVICEKYGKTYPKELERQCYGGTDGQICESVVQRMMLPISVDEFEHQLSMLVGKSIDSAPVQPGAERLLTHLYDHKIPTALATNSTEAAVRKHVAARPKLFALFNHRVCATDPEVDRAKPNPDIYLVAASRFPTKPKPAECLVFEDSHTGVKAGIAAGMQVVMIPDRRLDREKTRLATKVVRSLLEFKPEEFGLPPFPDIPKHRSSRLKDHRPLRQSSTISNLGNS